MRALQVEKEKMNVVEFHSNVREAFVEGLFSSQLKGHKYKVLTLILLSGGSI